MNTPNLPTKHFLSIARFAVLLPLIVSSACAMPRGVAPLVPELGVNLSSWPITDVASAVAQTQYPTSGGQTLASAERIEQGSTVAGLVSERYPRYYQVYGRAGQELRFTWHTQVATMGRGGAGANPRLSVLDAHGGRLASELEATYATTGSHSFDREELAYTPKTTGLHYVQVSCERCIDCGVHYKLMAQ